MTSVETTKMSSKGQVVIPEGIRQRLGLKSGDSFVVVADRDVVVLKAVVSPSMLEFDDLIRQARKEARKAGLTKTDVATAIARARAQK